MTVTDAPVLSAPVAPGRLGAPASAPEYLAYLDALRRWRDGRRAELDRLDKAALAAARTDAFTPDITLAMGLWQAISDRYEQLVRTWDSGRVGRAELEQLTQLIFGRLDAGLGTGLAVSFTEALTLSDALASQLRARLSLDPTASGAAARIPMLRAQLVRLRELVKADGSNADPAVTATIDRLAARLEDLATRALAGGDVGGEIAGFDAEATRLERDLIVASSRRRDLAADRARAETTRAELVARAPALVELAARCTDKIAGAPRLAVPDPSTLGPVPEDRAGVDTYLQRLALVRTALDTVEAAYGGPLAEREDLRGVVKAFQAKALALGVAEQVPLLAAWEQVRAILWSAPCDLAAGRDAVAAYTALVRQATDPPATPTPTRDQA